jgi:large subunit ribosomal protein L10
MAKSVLKQPIVDEIKGLADKANSAVLMDYCGLTVEQDTQLRKKLRDAGVSYKVYKNTLLNRAFEGTDFAQLANDLNGPTAVAFSFDDATLAARLLAETAKTMDKLEFKSGVVGGTYYDQAGIKVIATIPSREVLLGRLLGSIQSPITNFARVIKQIAESKEGKTDAA